MRWGLLVPYLKQGWQDVGPIGVMIRPSFRMLTKHPDDELPEVSLLTADHVVSRPLRYQPHFVRDGIAQQSENTPNVTITSHKRYRSYALVQS